LTARELHQGAVGFAGDGHQLGRRQAHGQQAEVGLAEFVQREDDDVHLAEGTRRKLDAIEGANELRQDVGQQVGAKSNPDTNHDDG
jgi:hypothetical protein